MTTVIEPKIIEGSSREVAERIAELNGSNRVRVLLLPVEEEIAPIQPSLQIAPTGRFAVRAQEAFAEYAKPATEEEKAASEREVRELLEALNENRRRDGAEPVW